MKPQCYVMDTTLRTEDTVEIILWYVWFFSNRRSEPLLTLLCPSPRSWNEQIILITCEAVIYYLSTGWMLTPAACIFLFGKQRLEKDFDHSSVVGVLLLIMFLLCLCWWLLFFSLRHIMPGIWMFIFLHLFNVLLLPVKHSLTLLWTSRMTLGFMCPVEWICSG